MREGIPRIEADIMDEEESLSEEYTELMSATFTELVDMETDKTFSLSINQAWRIKEFETRRDYIAEVWRNNSTKPKKEKIKLRNEVISMLK